MSAQPLSPRPPSFWDSRTARLLGSILLIAALLAAYANSFHVPFILDDQDAIGDNATIRSLTTAWVPPTGTGSTTSGRPLLNVSVAINYALHGTDVFGYHVGNLFIHTLATLALWAVVYRTLRQPALGSRFAAHAVPLAWCAATLWALHPLQTESVTYIIQRAESLVGLFYFLTLYCFIRSVESVQARTNSALPLWPVLAVLSSVAGMASKEVMASAPLLVFLYDRTFISGSFGNAWRRHRRLHVALATTWLVLLVCIIQSGGRGATVGYTKISWWEYAFTQAPAIAGYLWRSVWPANLIFDYGPIVEKDLAVVIPACLFILTLMCVAIHALVRRPIAGFFFGWFFLILAPTSSVVPVATQTVAEHRMYLPLAGIIVPAVMLLHRWHRQASMGIYLALLLAAGVRTYTRNYDYRSSLAIWKDTVDRLPYSARALNNYGSMLLNEGRVAESIPQFQMAIEHVPQMSDAWNNLGTAFLRLEKNSEAIHAINHAITLNPNKASFHVGLGLAYRKKDEPLQAVAAFRRASELEPTTASHFADLANALLKAGRLEEAGQAFARARELAPADPSFMTDQAVWLRYSDRLSEAIALLIQALRISPDNALARSNLGIALYETGHTAEGTRELEKALSLDPDLEQTRYHLATAYAENNQPAVAIIQFEALIKLAPPSAEILDNLGTLYAQTGRYEDALATLQRALTLDPQHRNARRNLDALTTFMRDQTLR